MGFFQNIRNAIARFMYGRNGMDHLNRAIFWFYFALYIVRMLVMSVVDLKLLGLILDVAVWALAILFLFRAFSKNLYKRREENQKWLNWAWKAKNSRSAARARHADKDHKYFTCKNCKTICRVPAGKGKIIITCPKCGQQIEGKS